MVGNQFYNPFQQGYQLPQQQPLFPQPQGNVYFINNSVEVANVPMGGGISVAICTNEGLMYIKSLQNGSPTFMAYNITPYIKEEPKQQETQSLEENRLSKIESQIEELMKIVTKQKGGNLSELL